MKNLRRRIEELENETLRRIIEADDRRFAGWTADDLEFFAKTGNLPPGLTPGAVPTRKRVISKQMLREQKFFLSRSPEEYEYYALNGRWPRRL